MTMSKVVHLGLSDAEEDALVAIMQTLTDGFRSRNQP
jgi:cytochrome c peroxidase